MSWHRERGYAPRNSEDLETCGKTDTTATRRKKTNSFWNHPCMSRQQPDVHHFPQLVSINTLFLLRCLALGQAEYYHNISLLRSWTPRTQRSSTTHDLPVAPCASQLQVIIVLRSMAAKPWRPRTRTREHGNLRLIRPKAAIFTKRSA